MKFGSICALALLVAVPSVALSQSEGSGEAVPHLHDDSHAHPESPAIDAFMHANRKMMSDMHNVVPTGNTDADFVMMMIPHHQGAIDMAQVQLDHGTDPELRALAEKIIADQEREIAEMEAWLKEHGG